MRCFTPWINRCLELAIFCLSENTAWIDPRYWQQLSTTTYRTHEFCFLARIFNSFSWGFTISSESFVIDFRDSTVPSQPRIKFIPFSSDLTWDKWLPRSKFVVLSLIFFVSILTQNGMCMFSWIESITGFCCSTKSQNMSPTVWKSMCKILLYPSGLSIFEKPLHAVLVTLVGGCF